MLTVFYVAGGVALLTSILGVTRKDAMHGLLYLVVSFLALSVIFYLLGAPFIAALEVVVYAGAIVVLFIFAVMLFDLRKTAVEQEQKWLSPRAWLGPTLLATLLFVEIVYLLFDVRVAAPQVEVAPQQVSTTLFGPYLIGVELASVLLLAGLVAAYHLGRELPTPWLQPPGAPVEVTKPSSPGQASGEGRSYPGAGLPRGVTDAFGEPTRGSTRSA